jgi:hypothetical protein
MYQQASTLCIGNVSCSHCKGTDPPYTLGKGPITDTSCTFGKYNLIESSHSAIAAVVYKIS